MAALTSGEDANITNRDHDEFVSLKTSKGELFFVRRSTLQCMEKFKDELNVPNNSSTCLRVDIETSVLCNVLHFCSFFAAAKKEKFSYEEIEDWPDEVLSLQDNKQMFFSVMVAAHKLEIPLLCEVLAKKIADDIRGKTGEQIRQAYQTELDD